jgi:phospholipase C
MGMARVWIIAWVCGFAWAGISTAAPLQLEGTVSFRRAVHGVSVQLLAADGQSLSSAPTDGRGSFHLNAAQLATPFILWASGTDDDGAPIYLANLWFEGVGSKDKGPLRVNINPLTSLLTQRLLGRALMHAPEAAELHGPALRAERLVTERKALLQRLQPLFEGLQVAAPMPGDLGAHAAPGTHAEAQLRAFLSRTRVVLRAGEVSAGGLDGVRVRIPFTGAWPASVALSDTQRAALKQVRARATTTPIEHLIVIVGENQTFDSIFATYVPASGEAVRNLLSAGIVRSDGTPGAQYARAAQFRALPQPRYSVSPPPGSPYPHLPRPTLIGVYDTHFKLVGQGPDPRFPPDLAPGPFQITRYVHWLGRTQPPTLQRATSNLSAATGDPVHRFFQMWQQTGGDNTSLNLYTWVAVTTGMGGDTQGITPKDTGQGGEVMGFVNIGAGDAPLFRDLATRYAMSDNFHQSIMGGTGANFIALSTGDVAFYVRGGKPARPPENQIEDPDPAPGSENFYRRDGYEGGSYVACADPKQPGVAPILAVLERHHLPSRCEPGHYYLVNNYSAGYDLDGHPQPLSPNNYHYPPQTVRTIGEALSAAGVSWGWYTGGRDAGDLKEEMSGGDRSLAQAKRLQYNNIGDPLVGSTAIMTHAPLRAHLRGLASFSAAVRAGSVPAVAFLVPKNLDSGHPGYSVLTSFEEFVANILAEVRAQPALWEHSAIVVTMDEGGGHLDSGYIQTLDFFGDGPRIPLIVVSPHARPGYIDHVYADHASILKFIERNWQLAPLSARSRDNLADAVAGPSDPYRPVNGPAIGDLMTLFDF